MSGRRGKRRGWRRVLNGLNLASLLIVVFVSAPLYWLISTSLKPPVEIGATPPTAYPHPLVLTNFRQAFLHYGFGRYLLNSVIVSLLSTVLVLALGILAGYALGRFPMRGKLPVLMGLLMISVFPAIAVISPLYLIMRELGWLNSYQALILPYTAFNLPFAIWILRNYFIGIPPEMEEVGRLDGASPLRTLWSIILPQARPGIFTAAVFTFTACWTEFLMAVSFNSANNYRTIAVGIALFGSSFVVPYGTIFAASVAAVLPIAILVLVFRRSVVSGLTAGAVKG